MIPSLFAHLWRQNGPVRRPLPALVALALAGPLFVFWLRAPSLPGFPPEQRAALAGGFCWSAWGGLAVALLPSSDLVGALEGFTWFGLSALARRALAFLGFFTTGSTALALAMAVTNAFALQLVGVAAPWWAHACVGLTSALVINAVRTTLARIRVRKPVFGGLLLTGALGLLFLGPAIPHAVVRLAALHRAWTQSVPRLLLGLGAAAVASLVAIPPRGVCEPVPGRSARLEGRWFWVRRELINVRRNPRAILSVVVAALYPLITLFATARVAERITILSYLVFMPGLYCGYVLGLNLWGFEAGEADKYKAYPLAMREITASKFAAGALLGASAAAYALLLLAADTLRLRLQHAQSAAPAVVLLAVGLAAIGLRTSRKPFPVPRALDLTGRTVSWNAVGEAIPFCVAPAVGGHFLWTYQPQWGVAVLAMDAAGIALFSWLAWRQLAAIRAGSEQDVFARFDLPTLPPVTPPNKWVVTSYAGGTAPTGSLR